MVHSTMYNPPESERLVTSKHGTPIDNKTVNFLAAV